MPRPFLGQLCSRGVVLVGAGRPVTTAAAELGSGAGALHHWVRPLETGVEILRRAASLLDQDRLHPSGLPR